MADAVDLLHINDITIMRTLDPEDILAEWKDMKLLARVQVDNELLDETVACLPIIYEGVGARPVTRWELGNFQVPTDCCPFALIIMTTGCFEIFRFEIQRGSDGISVNVKEETFHCDFRGQVILLHSPSHLHRRYLTAAAKTLKMDVHVEPRDEFSHWFPEATSAAIRLYVGRHYYTLFRRGGQRQHLKLARTTLEGALEDPIIDPGLSQVLEAVIPFLYCIEQGYSSCLDVALEVLQTFPGLDGQFDAQLLLHMVVHDIGHCFEWYDHVPQIIKSITGPLKLLLHSASPRAWKLLVAWVTLAHSVARDAMEVLPLMDLVVDFHSGFSGSEGFELLPIMRATVYFKQAVNPGGPSLSTALGAADFVMYSLAGRELSPHLGPTFGLVFVDQSIAWLLVVLSRNLTGTETMPQKDRLLSFVTWLLSNLPFKLPPELQGLLREIRSCLRGNACRLTSEMVKGGMSRPPTLDDNDNQFIEETFQDLHQQTSGKEIPTEYPKGAAELVKNFLMDANSGLRVLPSPCGMVATISCALRLPETFKMYELFMSCLEESQSSTIALTSSGLSGADVSRLIVRDAISCASEMGNHRLALQWSDQGRSQIWNWLFHSRSSIGQGATTDPVIARKLKTRPSWIDSWVRHQQGEPKRYDHLDSKDVYLDISGYNRVPGLERFLRPKTPAEIISLAEVLGGPIVYLNPNRYSPHALAVLPGLDDIVHIPLPDLQDILPGLNAMSVEFMKSPQAFLREGFSMQRLWERKGFKVDAPGKRPTPSVGVPAVSFLAFLWNTVVKPVLDGLGIQHTQKPTADMPRIWWCPSGPLIGLPIHAAGLYMDDGQGPVISDYAVSSYFPSASALAYATRPEDPSQKFSLLTVANPTGAGLPGTEWELEKIKTRTKTQELTRGEATIEKVKKGMENTSWAHFACHGMTHSDKPWESALILANHTRLTLREISDMSLPHVEFAYLSACQTAKGVAEAPDESADLSMGMLACGYRSVIGTLWKISDEYAPFVADHVYEKMLEGGQPDYKRAACALHDAVQALRKEHKVGFATWLPFIHVGV